MASAANGSVNPIPLAGVLAVLGATVVGATEGAAGNCGLREGVGVLSGAAIAVAAGVGSAGEGEGLGSVLGRDGRSTTGAADGAVCGVGEGAVAGGTTMGAAGTVAVCVAVDRGGGASGTTGPCAALEGCCDGGNCQPLASCARVLPANTDSAIADTKSDPWPNLIRA